MCMYAAPTHVAFVVDRALQLDTTCENIDKHIKEDKPFSFFRAFRCCAVDVIFNSIEGRQGEGKVCQCFLAIPCMF